MRMKRWLEWAAVALAAGMVAAYAGDWAVYRMRGSPRATVTVNSYVTIPLKGRKQEFDYQGTYEAPCVEALFPRDGLSPCWRARRAAAQGMTM